jgi:sugar O-acyltransferase (sialic acid O-acetyltransferase NeuD family)
VQKVVLFGNGQMTSMIHFYLSHDSTFQVVAFTVDGDQIKETTLFGLPVIAFEEIENRYPPDEVDMSIPISYRRVNQLRAEKYGQAKEKGYRLINYVSSKATIWPDLTMGDNCIVLEGCIVQPFAEIGNDVIMGCNSLVGHHSVISDHCFLAPGSVTLGNVRVGSYCFLGANSTVRDGVTLSGECVVGAGVTIGRNTKDREVYIDGQTDPLAKRSDELRQWLTWLR